MAKSEDIPGPSAAVETLEVELRRFTVAAVDSQTVALRDLQEDDSSSSSSESSAGLPGELHPADGTRAGPSETLSPSTPEPNDASVGLLYDQSMEQHFGPADHYERPARIIQLHATLQEQGLMGRCWQLVPRQATDEELLLAHSEEHIRKVDSMFSELYPSRPDTLAEAEYCYADGRMGDVYLCTGTARAARMAAGCCVRAVESVLSGTVSRALAVVRPPGHHAECERAMGFCFFNNVALAALAALRHPGIRRVAVLDWDVHHGNGIQNLLYSRPDALYLSIHRDPKRFYPYQSGFLAEAGEGPGTGFNVNVPWVKKGMGDGDYVAAFLLIVEPILESYQPDLVIVAAGFDAADGDPLGGCKLSPEGYGWMTERLVRFARGRLVLALEGGYNNRVTSWCVAACVRTMLEGAASPLLPPDKEHLWPTEAHNSLKLVYEFQRQYWPVLRSRSWTEAWEAHLKDVHRMLGSNVRSKRSSAGSNSNGRSAAAAAAAAVSSSSSDAACGGVGGGGRAAAAVRSPSPAAAIEEAPTTSTSVRGAARRSGGGGTAAAAGARRSSSSGGGGNAACGGGGGGPPRAPAPQSLQEAFKARKAAREAATAAAAATATAAAAAERAAAATTAPAAGEAAAVAPSVASTAEPAQLDAEAVAGVEPAPPPAPPSILAMTEGLQAAQVSAVGAMAAVRDVRQIAAVAEAVAAAAALSQSSYCDPTSAGMVGSACGGGDSSDSDSESLAAAAKTCDSVDLKIEAASELTGLRDGD